MYNILGVSSSATLDEIKRQYRTLAKEHHPDKGGNPEVFADIANAYETLSDPVTRRRYDQSQYWGRNGKQPKPRNAQQETAQFRAQQYQRQKQQQQEETLRKAQEWEEKLRKQKTRVARVKEARLMQKNLLHATTLQDLLNQGILKKQKDSGGETVLVFQKNFLGAFCGNKQEEKVVLDEFFFPYPFEGPGRNGMIWGNVLQTAKIRFNKATDLTRLFGVNVDGRRDVPYIVFGRAGMTVKEGLHVFRPRKLSDPPVQLEHWVTTLLATRVTMINSHFAPVKLFLILDQTVYAANAGVHLATLEPNHEMTLALHVGDKIVAIDDRVDAFPGSPKFESTTLFASSRIGSQSDASVPKHWFFTNPAILDEYLVDIETTIEIKESRCFDLSLQCHTWATVGDKKKKLYSKNLCAEQPEFMHHLCPASCGVCVRQSSSTTSTPFAIIAVIENWWHEYVSYPLYQAPLYTWSTWTRPMVQFVRYSNNDFVHVMNQRPTIGYLFLTLGAVLGVNLFLLPTWLMGGGTHSATRLSWRDLGLLSALSGTIGFWAWLHVAAPNSSLRRDWEHVLEWQMDALLGLIGWGVAFLWTCKLISASIWSQRDLATWTVKIIYSSLVLLLFASLTVVVGLLVMDMDPTRTREQRWFHLWTMRKNVATALVATGIVVGLALPAMWRALCRFPELVFIAALNVMAIGALDSVSMKDPHFWQDLNHVLQVRMSGAVPIAVAGLFLGFALPFGVLELLSELSEETDRPPKARQTKYKTD